ncbi:hypothetical protein [Polynucleobacter sp. JS-Fieb-80-E5]|uniref:hypothetical protein n=1 Tax=Polynucleobacter sp. JS-Fieb-80-E5 TaxID=2081050 RepID=UPI001C0B6D95|nr:hypothetical protein [Polynucleobacter sp. JS-Fieb-80-E5]MBU3619943.1 hypothetical protein [Polynucleobacter sp. JS-Fieb-80-E5]
MKSHIHIFFLSLIAVLATLIFERAIGIEWDFHPDSVTYATTSHEISQNILNEGFGSAINNSYYFLCSLLGQNIVAIIAMNMIFFALTNLIILKLHIKFAGDLSLEKYSLLLLLVLNPYRMHLATTMLKDTLIIFLALISLMGARCWIISFITMPFLRVIGVFYYGVLLPKVIFAFGVFCAICIFFIFNERVVGLMLEFNANQMQFREFDSVPSFQDSGLAGIGIRFILWPILALTASFSLFGLSVPFMAVALGVVMFNVYTFALVGRSIFTWKIFISMGVFAILVTGYGSYIRYVYPFLVMAPLLVISQSSSRLRYS